MNKKIYSYSSLDTEELNKELETSIVKGLNNQQIKEKLKIFQANSTESEEVKWWQIFGRQFKSAFIYLLILAAILSWIFGERLESVMILLFVFVNAFLGFYQEYKSEQALKMLQQYTVSMVKVLREGKEIVIKSNELVPGDIVLLETGELVPADIRLLGKECLVIDETVLTGESVAVHKDGALITTPVSNIYEAKNLIFAGTTIVSGSSKGVVIATGKQSTFGQIKTLTTETVKESIFAKGINKFSKFILRLIIITLVFVFLGNLIIKGQDNIKELLIFSIALAVSVIPEALPLVTTLSLSRGALRLAKKKVIVKRLSAIEDLGSIEVLCTDKTGTITENELVVAESLPFNGENLLFFANLAGSAGRETLEPFDKALWQALSENEIKDISNFTRLSEIPFDPKRKRNSVLLQNNKNQEKVLIVRGAPEEIVSLSGNMDSKEKKIYANWITTQGDNGKRALSVAIKTITNYQASYTLEKYENDLTFIGCISFEDPIKKSTYKAVEKAKQVGVQIKIITGDSKEVSFNVAKKIGLIETGMQVVTAAEFLKLPLNKQKEICSKIAVFARTDPEQKYNIIKLLQDHFEVGFLGEGINDAPALKVAGVSIVVQSASGIAREAADIILLKKNLEVIIDGVKEGREIFANTIKYLKATIASNFGNFYAVAISSLFIDFLPMLPMQILLLNLLSDFPMISIATDNVDPAELEKPTKYNVRDIILISTFLGIISTVFDFMVFGLFYKISPAVLQTNWFISSILTELIFLFSIRTHLPFYKSKLPSLPILGLTAVAGVATIAIPFTGFGQTVFKFTPPSLNHLLTIFGLIIAYFTCSEIVKILYYRNEEAHKKN